MLYLSKVCSLFYAFSHCLSVSDYLSLYLSLSVVGRNGETHFDTIASSPAVSSSTRLQDSVMGVSRARLLLSSRIVDEVGLILSRYDNN